MRILFTAALLSTVALPGAGYAQCVTGTDLNGDPTWTCSGDTTATIIDQEDPDPNNNIDDATVTIQSSASVVTDGRLIRLDDDATITLEANSVLTSSDDEAIDVDKRATVTVNTGANLTAKEKAIDMGDDSEVTVFGTVTSTGNEAIEGEDGATITVESGGVVKAFDDAIQVAEDGTITNHGLIENTAMAGDDPQDAIDIDQGIITNTGTIKSTIDAAIDYDDGTYADSEIINSGTITGTIGVETDPDNIGVQKITNSGTIEGTSGLALNLGQGADVYMHSFGTLIGGVDMGLDDDLFEVGFANGGQIGGIDAIIDGGAGVDTLFFSNTDYSEIIAASLLNDVFTLDLVDATTPIRIAFTNFELIAFRDLTATPVSAALAGPLTPVPLPAPVMMLGGAILALFGLRRRGQAAS